MRIWAVKHTYPVDIFFQHLIFQIVLKLFFIMSCIKKKNRVYSQCLYPTACHCFTTWHRLSSWLNSDQHALKFCCFFFLLLNSGFICSNQTRTNETWNHRYRFFLEARHSTPFGKKKKSYHSERRPNRRLIIEMVSGGLWCRSSLAFVGLVTSY